MTFVEDFNEPKSQYFAAEDSNFVVGDSPVVLDIEDVLRGSAIDGSIRCSSAAGGDILVEFICNGGAYGSQFTVNDGETYSLKGHKIGKIRITHSGTDSGYRVLAR